MPPPIRMKPELLNEVFRFKFKAPSERQDEQVCAELVHHVSAFILSIQPIDVDGFGFSTHDPLVDDRTVPLHTFAYEENAALQRAYRILTCSSSATTARSRDDIWIERWLPQYGCALQMELTSVSSIALRLVFLDAWAHVVHFPPGGVDCIHTAAPKHFAVLNCGSVHPRLKDKLLIGLRDEIEKAKQRTGTNRSAAFNEIGHQKTPQFIAMMLRRVQASLGKTSHYGYEDVVRDVQVTRGGTTDVGLHTGGRSRDTCWPLVQGVLKQNLPGSGALWDKTMLMFQFCLLAGRLNEIGSYVAGLSSGGGGGGGSSMQAFWVAVEDTFAMLQSVVLQTVALVQRGYSAKTLEKKCAVIRKHLFAYTQQVYARTAQLYALPSTSELSAIRMEMTHPLTLPLTAVNVFNQPAAANFDPNAHARQQLKYYVFVDASKCPTASVLTWASSSDSASTRASISLVALRTIECLLFRKASLLLKTSTQTNAADGDDDDYTPEQLRNIVTHYEKHLARWKQAALASDLMDVEQRSLAMLVKWIVFCLAHHAFAATYDELHDFSIALQWQNLGVSVLRTREAIDAMSAVAAYIRSWNASRQEPLFDLNNPAPTAQFARVFASKSTTYLNWYNEARQQLEAGVAAHWSAIVKKKEQAKAIRSEIAVLEETIEEWRERLQVLKDELEVANRDLPWNHRRLGNSETKSCKEQIRQLNGRIRRYKHSLEQTLEMPTFLMSLLPKDRASALQTLFFIDMPSDMALLFEFCLSAQRALAPYQLSVRECQLLRDNRRGVEWREFFFSKGGNTPLSSQASTTLRAYQETLVAPYNHGPASVESVKSCDECARLCVWYPSEKETFVVWTDASGTPTNPFNITTEMMIKGFTHEMPSQFKALQWAIARPGGADRGNLVYSKLGEPLPDDFDHRSFVQFGSLRAFPHLQIRKLCCAIQNNSLPWSHPCVVAVVRQALYQVGQLSDEDAPQSMWKVDLRRSDGLEVLCAALSQAASRLDLTPRDFENVPLLGEIAGFVSQFDLHARAVVSKFIAMCQRWAKDIRTQWQTDRTMSSADVAELRAKECLLYGYALQSCGLTDPSFKSSEIGELVVLFRNAMLFANGSSAYAAIQRLEVTIDEIMARRIAQVKATHRSNELTTLVRLVNARVPQGLIWRYYTYELDGYFESYWFTTDSATGTHYAINLFTGVVLTDGSSPGGLPSHIRQSAQYQRLFGDQDFEVSFSRGVYRTAYAVQGCCYEFAVADTELYVREVYCDDAARVTKTLELCSSAHVKTLAAALPARVAELYSLWYWLERDCVLARPPAASEKLVEFVIDVTETRGTQRDVKAFQVPTADKALSHDELFARRTRYEYFVKISESLRRIVRKFEADKYIHTLCTADGRLKIHLPRFRLSFVLRESQLDGASSCELQSLEYEGYVLDPQQQFTDAFPNFARYLVLRLESETSSQTKPKVRIVAPFGQVVRASNGAVDIVVSDVASARLDVAVFDVHRRLKTLSTESIASRLLLCVLLASTGLNTPSEYFEMTGAEAALQVLKGCYFSHEFSSRDKALLRNLCMFAHREPALKILASCILQKSLRCAFLTSDATESPLSAIDCTNELDAYCAMCVESPERNALRTSLDSTQERLVLGSPLQHASAAKWLRAPLSELSASPVSATFVRDVEETLARFLGARAPAATAVPVLQLTLVDSDAMSRAMNAELQDSWCAYHEHPDRTLAQSLDALASTCELLLANVREKRRKVKTYLLDAVRASRDDTVSRMLATINYLPTPTVADLIRSSFDSTVLLQLVPRLSAHARSVFKTATLQFMELCVLEDKLERLVHGAQQSTPPPETYFVDELSSVRQWESSEHPYWLAFEVEGRLQIRHEQYVVAKHLIKNAGAVCQMNMGRGKTRVILPMLFLYFSHRERGHRIVRAHFLTPLLSETRQFMHQHLSASTVLGLHFIEQPFHRNIELDTDRLELLREDLDEARECGKFLVVAPEHRMSLELKRLELASADADADSAHHISVLDEILDDAQYMDVLDESDAILHHKYHLIYAVGVPQRLESGESRWLATQALLRVLSGASSKRVQMLLQQPHICFQSPEYVSRPGGYTGLRLNASVVNKESLRHKLREAMVLDLMDSAPFSMTWLKTYASEHTDEARSRLVMALTDPTVNLDAMIGDDDAVLRQYWSQVLAVRGLLAFGILEHCLEKRHRVEYGLPDPKTRPKRMAIPFRAADIPSERSEFSHPEVGIASTVLAYYHTGLRECELKEALTQLLQLGVAEQEQFYSKWVDSVRAAISDTDRKELPLEANQLSPRDSRQFALLYRVYRYATEAINFFLNTCVFPTDTTQYPSRLSRTAWNLAGGDWAIGFSGTNDNHRLLPTSMRQHEPPEPSLLGTNGKMIDRILNVSVGYEIIHSDQQSAISWQMLLQSALRKRMHALIDTGALLAGVLNNDAALYLLDCDDFTDFAGVTYYDTRKAFDCWVVLDANNRIVTPLKQATILEKDTFVIFDDARSRGSDMKLKSNAVAMLTLGPKITKDKLMQGAGRMRQLGCDQTLWLASLSEVAQSILQVSGKASVQRIHVVDILDWVMHTTKSEAVHGLLEWASSGLHFSKTRIDSDPSAELLDDDWSLNSLYAAARHPEAISNIVRAKAHELFADDDEDELDELIDTICARSAAFGLDEEVLVTAHSEECERELQNEHYEEREGEVERARFQPVNEVAWDFSALLRVRSVRQLADVVQVTALGDFVRESIAPVPLTQINWASAQLYGTGNFFATVAVPLGARVTTAARLIDVILLFEDGTKLLVSEFEADAILSLLWTSKASHHFAFVHLPYVATAIEKVGARADLHYVPLVWYPQAKVQLPRLLCASLSALCQLYNGETMFTKTRAALIRQALRGILSPLQHRERTLQSFIGERGNLPKWRYSLLHELCHEMDLEAIARPTCSKSAVRTLTAGVTDLKNVRREVTRVSA